jgi:hypothetical protein
MIITAPSQPTNDGLAIFVDEPAQRADAVRFGTCPSTTDGPVIGGSVLADTGVYAANVAIGVFIGATAPDRVPHMPPDEIARVYWDLHNRRVQAEHVIRP